MKKTAFILLGITLLFSLTTCLDEIEIDLPDRPEEGYVVQAKLVRGNPSFAEVSIERIFQYTSNANQAVAGAEVRLVKDNGFDVVFPINLLGGVYQYTLEQQTYPVNPGDRFRVEVTIADSILIHSDWETVYEVPQAERLEWQLDETETVSLSGIISRVPAISFGVTTPITIEEKRARLRWDFSDAYRITDDGDRICYIENRYQSANVYLLDGATVAHDTVQNFPLFTAPLGIRHIEGYYLSAYQQALSPSSFSYWQEVASLNEREGTIFDNPAGRVSTNFKDQSDSTRIIYGYFSAFSQDTVRLFVSREDAGELDSYCPLPARTNSGPTICDDCIIHGGNSSLNKPYYWEE